jgi:hypothetical protein
MRTASRFALASALGVLCIGLFAAGALAIASAVGRHTNHRSHVLRGAVERVAVEGDSGDVTLRSGAAGRVTVDEKRHYWMRRPKLELALRDGVLTVRVDCGSFGPGCSDDLAITAPADVARASVAVDSGDVSLSAFTAGEIDVRADSGDIDAADLAGTVHLESDSGHIKATGLRADTVTASADSGDVAVTLLTAPQVLAAHADSGDVDVAVPTDRYRVDADADSGDVNVKGVLRDDTAARRITASADSGDVTVHGR